LRVLWPNRVSALGLERKRDAVGRRGCCCYLFRATSERFLASRSNMTLNGTWRLFQSQALGYLCRYGIIWNDTHLKQCAAANNNSAEGGKALPVKAIAEKALHGCKEGISRFLLLQVLCSMAASPPTELLEQQVQQFWCDRRSVAQNIGSHEWPQYRGNPIVPSPPSVQAQTRGQGGGGCGCSRHGGGDKSSQTYK
jgi:hypothetical protein